MKYRLYFIFIFLLGYLDSAAQEPHVTFRKIDASNGLSSNQVSSIFRDSSGYMWFATAYGINRFDGKTIKAFSALQAGTPNIWNGIVDRIFEDPNGRIWFSSPEGTVIFDPEKENFVSPETIPSIGGIPASKVEFIYSNERDKYWMVHQNGLSLFDAKERKTINLEQGQPASSKILNAQVIDILNNDKGLLYLIYENGVLDLFSEEKLQVISRWQVPGQIPTDGNFRLTLDQEGDLWISMPGANLGIYYFEPQKERFTRLHAESSLWSLNTNMVSGAILQEDGSVWLGTDHGGINIIDKKQKEVQYLVADRENPSGLSQNSINSIYKDSEGIIWIGTYKKGINYSHESFQKFRTYRSDPQTGSGLPYDDVNRFAEDSLGNLWIGTNGGGLIYMDRKRGKFTTYRHDPKDPNSISSDVIVSLLIDNQQQLWVGTYLGGLERFTGNGFQHFGVDDPANAISDRNVWELFEDRSGNLWVGTLKGGLDQYDNKYRKIQHFDINTLPSNYIAALAEDHLGQIWIGTNEGLAVWQPETEEFRIFDHDPKDPHSISHNNIYDIHMDAQNRVWVATQRGLNYYRASDQAFVSYTQKDGLPHDAILTLLSDDLGHLWASTPNGISRIQLPSKAEISSTDSLVFANFTDSDGLQGISFNENAALKTQSGELLMGGANGFNLFDPSMLPPAPPAPKTVITDLILFNEQVQPGREISGRVLMEKAPAYTQKITLKHFENVFSLEFSALNYLFPEKNTYRYRLLGFNKNWLSTHETNSRVTYTNLDPGNYTFQVMASNNEGVWSHEISELDIEVLPPFWKTWYAYLLYGLLVLAGIVFWRRQIQLRERAKFQLEQEHQETLRMQELDRMKTTFFTNISHEFRTPLTLILAPLEKLLGNVSGSPKEEQYLQTIHKNTKRLLNLVNQLLDFRKIEVQGIPYTPALGDVMAFIGDTVGSFMEISEKKSIQMVFHPHAQELLMEFDADKLEKMLFNLLSNAFKFTPENGEIRVKTYLDFSKNQEMLAISVEDNGPGIAEENQEKIFQRFYQGTAQNDLNQGSGIGLSLALDFARLHGGDISVKSSPGKGSTFTLILPIQQGPALSYSKQTANKALASSVNIEGELPTPSAPSSDSQKQLPLVLVVEDNGEFRQFMANNLLEKYRIKQAKNGKEGWEMTLDHMPDLVISDVMMPEQNGIELCQQIKSDIRTSHIPVILLTARSAEEQQLEGYETGANHYVTKPFHFDLLLSKINNLLEERKVLQKHYNKQISVQASDREIVSLDEKLIHNAIKLVEEHLDNADFTVEAMSKELNMSRVQLYKKLHSLTGKTPTAFIREIRLQHGAQLLTKSQLTVAEIAYQVGFNDVRYFTKHFKNTYHISPSEYRKK